MNAGSRQRFVVLGENGPFVVHNCVQALARDVIAGIAYKVWKLAKLTPVLMVHDELAYIVKNDYAETVLRLLDEEMRTPPEWWPELVTWSEGDFGDVYGELK